MFSIDFSYFDINHEIFAQKETDVKIIDINIYVNRTNSIITDSGEMNG